MALVLHGVAISLPSRPLIKAMNLTIESGEIVTLMGESGSGKSSLLAFIAGDLGPPFRVEGEVSLNGKSVSGLAPERRRIGRLFQDDLLFPHMTVGENLLFGLPRGNAALRRDKMREALRHIGMAEFEHRPPHTLSGGQRSRAALMRALLAEPSAMLLDEPFNKLDANLKGAMREFVFNHLRERAIPCLLVSHDRADAPRGSRILTITANAEVRDD